MQRMEIINFKICYAFKTEIKTSSIKDVESIFCFPLLKMAELVLLLDTLNQQCSYYAKY